MLSQSLTPLKPRLSDGFPDSMRHPLSGNYSPIEFGQEGLSLHCLGRSGRGVRSTQHRWLGRPQPRVSTTARHDREETQAANRLEQVREQNCMWQRQRQQHLSSEVVAQQKERQTIKACKGSKHDSRITSPKIGTTMSLTTYEKG